MKTAKNMLERYQNPRDQYERNIRNAAAWLVENGMSDWKYSTQWISGNSQWYSPQDGAVMTVKNTEPFCLKPKTKID